MLQSAFCDLRIGNIAGYNLRTNSIALDTIYHAKGKIRINGESGLNEMREYSNFLRAMLCTRINALRMMVLHLTCF